MSKVIDGYRLLTSGISDYNMFFSSFNIDTRLYLTFEYTSMYTYLVGLHR